MQTPPQRTRPGWQAQAPPTQASPTSQLNPQAPQFDESRVRSRHALPQAIVSDGQVQTPAWHAAPCGHRAQLAPQCSLSVAISKQRAPAQLWGWEQLATHRPASQNWAAGHVVPQPPQFAGSVRTLVHAPSQSCSPAAQAHTPAMQRSPELRQGEKHAPHDVTPCCRSTQKKSEHSAPRPWQSQTPFRHGTPGPQYEHEVFPPCTHRPSVQLSSSAQALPQRPQCEVDVWRSTQLEPHAVRGGSQLGPGLWQVKSATQISSPGHRPSKSQLKPAASSTFSALSHAMRSTRSSTVRFHPPRMSSATSSRPSTGAVSARYQLANEEPRSNREGASLRDTE